MACAASILLGSPLQAQTPVADWEFDAGAGRVAVDSQGSANTAALRGGAGWSEGLTGAHALHLPGRPDSFVEAPNGILDTTRSYAVTACVKLGRAAGWQTFVSIDGDRVSGFFLQLRGDTGEFAFTTLSRDDPGGETRTAGSHVDPIEGVWYSLTGVYDAAAQTLALYVNGELQQTVPAKFAWKAVGHAIVGRGKYDGHAVDFANGDIDSVRMYDSVLAAPSIAALYARDLPVAARPVTGGTARISIDTAHPGTALSSTQHGLMTEEINYSYDGGLYGELIQNRAFRDAKAPSHWTLVGDTGTEGNLSVDPAHPLNPALPVSLKLTAASVPKGRRVGAANDGYWGIPVQPYTTYRASVWAKAAPGYTGSLTLDLESSDGKTAYAQARLPKLTANWKLYQVTLKTGAADAASLTNRFVVSVDRPGAVWLSLVSLFPPTYNDRPNGSRIDIMQKLAGLKPTFLRFPGGNYLEGDEIVNRFDWKRTLGPLAGRPGHAGPWGYRSSDGMGLVEFLDWCDDLHMTPLLAVYAGYSLNHYRNPNPQRVEPGPALKPFVQDALDEIEFLNGDTNTHWGAERARLGHPRPYRLSYVEVGNEDWFDASGSYDARFAQFYDAIRSKYPKLQIIATTPVRSRRPDVIDEHYYLSPREFERDTHHYDNYDRKGPKIFVGEWASQEGNPVADLSSALGDAAWLTGLERNSDMVVMETYAPLLVNVNPGASQWPHPNLIGYNAIDSFVSPSYHAQAMFASSRGNVCLPVVVEGAPRIACSVTRDDRAKIVYIKVVNPAGSVQPVSFALSGVDRVASDASVTVLTSANPRDENSLAEPRKVAPVESRLTGIDRNFRYTFAPNSFTVLRLTTQ